LPELKGCEEVQVQLEDISISLASCQADQNSTLCKSFARVVSKHPISSRLPKTFSVALPHTPFYWAMPTIALRSLEDDFGYRSEAASWWWEIWHLPFLSCIALLITFVSIWHGKSRWKTKKLRRAALLAQQLETQLEREIAYQADLARTDIECKRQAQLNREAEITEQQRIAAQHEVEKIAAEHLAKQVAERAESASLLEAAFAPAKGKRRKNVPTSK
jgi:hypothetical protein